MTRKYETASGHVVLIDHFVVLPARVTIGSHGYPQMRGGEQGQMVLLHRWLKGLQTGDKRQVDHDNRNRLDCRLENLRVVTPTQNNLNRTLPPRDLPRHVYRSPVGNYEVTVKRHYIKVTIGTFRTVGLAVAARNTYLATLGEFPPDNAKAEAECSSPSSLAFSWFWPSPRSASVESSTAESTLLAS